MNICGINYDKRLTDFLATSPRYRLAVELTNNYPEDVHALNIGYELTNAIKDMAGLPDIRFQLSVQECLNSIIRKHTFNDPTLGKCLILFNPGILFEPALGINVTNFFKWISQGVLTILLWPGEADERGLFFLTTKSKYTIKHVDLNYIII